MQRLKDTKYKSVMKSHIPSEQECEDILEKLGSWLPISREEIIRRAVYRYYVNHTFKRENGQWFRHNIVIDQEHKCYYCEKYITSKGSTLDHKVPLTRGGANERENLAACCPECNILKDSMTEEEFRGFLAQLK